MNQASTDIDAVSGIGAKPQLWHPAEVVVLVRLATFLARPRCRFLEIGSWLGSTTGLIATVAHGVGGTVDCVDTWAGSDGTTLGAVVDGDDPYNVFLARLRAWKLEDTCRSFRGRSQDICPNLTPGYDFAFVDGDHRYSVVSEDLANMECLVRPGGLICGHDYDIMGGGMADDWLEKHKEQDCIAGVHCGVVRAVDERFPNAHISGAGNIWYVTRGNS